MTDRSRVLTSEPIEDLVTYRRLGGLHGLEAARHRTPSSTVELIERAGLRGRGGAGFPTGRKWRTLLSAGPTPIVVVNAAEGEPGTFKDRFLLRTDPYLVLEGALIAAHTLAAGEIAVAINARSSTEIAAIRRAIAELETAGWCDRTRIRIKEGPDEYLFGEETALLEVIDGRPPLPRVVPPYRHGAGVDDLFAAPPTLVGNVETFANVPRILRHGADWYRSVGTERSPGTTICTVTGDVPVHGVAEFPMGTPMSQVIRFFGGDVDDVSIVLMGTANPPVARDEIDVPLSFEGLAGIASGLGSAGLVVVGRDRNLYEVAAGVARFLAVESCGQCEPCKLDGVATAEALRTGDVAEAQRRLRTVARGARCALAGQQERVVGRIVELAANDPASDAHRVSEPWPVVPLVDIVDGRAVLDTEHRTKRPDWTYPDAGHGSSQMPAQHVVSAPLRLRRRPEPAGGITEPTVGADRTAPHLAALHDAHRTIRAALTALRVASPAEQLDAVHRLGAALDRHAEVVERYVVPAIERVRPVDGSDLAWYPQHHEHEARRLVDRLEAHDGVIDPRAVDALCADVQVSLLELDDRVVPLLEESEPTSLDVDRLDRAVATTVRPPATG